MLKVHYDDPAGAYYTVDLDGKERATVRSKLTAIDAGASAGEAAEEALSWQVRAIMLQHAEDCKRMLPSDAGRLAVEAMRQLREPTLAHAV